MQTTLRTKISSSILGNGSAVRSTRLACRCQVSPRRASAQQLQASPSSSSAAMEQASLALTASMLPLAAALPAFADDDVISSATDAATDAAAAVSGAATDAAAAVTGAAKPLVFNMTATDLGIAFAPLIIYLIFSVYREKINPRAKITDLFFIIAALVVFGNIFSVLVFKKRIY